MKRFIFTILLCGAFAVAAPAQAGILDIFRTKIIRGSGLEAVRELPLTPFDALCTSRSVSVTLIAEGDKIRITGDDNVLDYIVITQVDGTMHITVDSKVRLRHAHIKITVPTSGHLRKLHASGSSVIICELPITGKSILLASESNASIVAAVTADECTLDASSSANIDAGVSAPKCNIKASSSSSITAAIVTSECDIETESSAYVTLSGEAETCDAECSSSSSLRAPRFIVKQYDIDVSGSAEANIRCIGHLKAEAHSAGSIRYSGNCTVVQEVSGSARIDKH